MRSSPSHQENSSLQKQFPQSNQIHSRGRRRTLDLIIYFHYQTHRKRQKGMGSDVETLLSGGHTDFCNCDTLPGLYKSHLGDWHPHQLCSHGTRYNQLVPLYAVHSVQLWVRIQTRMSFLSSGNSQRPKIAEHPITGLWSQVIFQETDITFRLASVLNLN